MTSDYAVPYRLANELNLFRTYSPPLGTIDTSSIDNMLATLPKTFVVHDTIVETFATLTKMSVDKFQKVADAYDLPKLNYDESITGKYLVIQMKRDE